MTLRFDLDLEGSNGSRLASKLRIEIIPDLRRNELSRIYAYMRMRSVSAYNEIPFLIASCVPFISGAACHRVDSPIDIFNERIPF